MSEAASADASAAAVPGEAVPLPPSRHRRAWGPLVETGILLVLLLGVSALLYLLLGAVCCGR